MSTDACDIKVGDKSLTDVLNVLTAQLNRLEAKVDSRQDTEQHTDPPLLAGATTTDNTSVPVQGPGPNSSPLGSTSPSEFDIQKRFENLRDSLSRIQLPPDCKVNESQQGIRSECKPALKVISKTARFAEAGLKLISQYLPSDAEEYALTSADIEKLYIIFQAQINYLQGEYSSLVVRSTFDEETSRLFRAFQNNSQAFSERSLNNVRLAAELTSMSSRHSRGNFSRSSYRGNSNRRGFSFGNRGGGRATRGFHPPDTTSTFPGTEHGSGH